LKDEFSNFDFHIFLSRENKDGFQNGYVWDFLTPENIEKFQEFYICGNPNMVDEVEKKLKNVWVCDENIFREKY
jgi:NAD(P)H-flavin reductase